MGILHVKALEILCRVQTNLIFFHALHVHGRICSALAPTSSQDQKAGIFLNSIKAEKTQSV